VLEVFTDTSIESPRTYLYVHYPGDMRQYKLFTGNVRPDGEENLMEGYRVKGHIKQKTNQ